MHDTAADGGQSPVASDRKVDFRHTAEFAPLLHELNATLLISTYHAGKLVVVGADRDGVNLDVHDFEQAMGIAVHPDRLAVGSRTMIWLLQSAPQLAGKLEPAGQYDACYLARLSIVTGNIQGHELVWIGEELWVVNTLFSCLCTLHEEYSFVPRWQPPFIRELSAGDRCHLNGVAVRNGRPSFVTLMAETNEPSGWRATKATSGAVLEVESSQTVSSGLAMPHSPRWHADKLWVLNSGHGALEIVEVNSGRREVVDHVPGYARGLAFAGPYAFVGMSRIRESSVFGDLPIAEQRDKLHCGVAVVDLRSGKSVAFLQFESGVEEVFDVQVLPGVKRASIGGPYQSEKNPKQIWLIAPPEQTPEDDEGGAMGTDSPPRPST
jgi:uncharacterized protein (TIGR03032 family)